MNGTSLGRFIDESLLTAGVAIRPGRTYGFFTDTSVCIGCKACEIACKTWNELPADPPAALTGMSYDNTRALSATTWRHVQFVEKMPRDAEGLARPMQPFQSRWLMMSNVCKHCEHAGCLESCPTGALFRTEFGSVVVQQDVCNGCGYCVPSCPFAVVQVSEHDGKAHKCTLCYDRMKGGLEPACAKACPTDSIQFGELHELYRRGQRRLAALHGMGVHNAALYGAPGGAGTQGGVKGLHAFFLLLARPEEYNLPAAPILPAARVPAGLLRGMATMAAFGLVAALAFLRPTED